MRVEMDEQFTHLCTVCNIHFLEYRHRKTFSTHHAMTSLNPAFSGAKKPASAYTPAGLSPLSKGIYVLILVRKGWLYRTKIHRRGATFTILRAFVCIICPRNFTFKNARRQVRPTRTTCTGKLRGADTLANTRRVIIPFLSDCNR